MNSFVVGYDHSASDKRVMRTVDALAELGTVYYQSSGKPTAENGGGIHHYSVEKTVMNGRFGLEKRRSFDKIIYELVRDLDYDLVYLHDFLHSMPLKAFRCARERGKKIIYDLHEIMPEQFFPERLSFLNPVLWKVLKT